MSNYNLNIPQSNKGFLHIPIIKTIEKLTNLPNFESLIALETGYLVDPPTSRTVTLIEYPKQFHNQGLFFLHIPSKITVQDQFNDEMYHNLIIKYKYRLRFEGFYKRILSENVPFIYSYCDILAKAKEFMSILSLWIELRNRLFALSYEMTVTENELFVDWLSLNSNYEYDYLLKRSMNWKSLTMQKMVIPVLRDLLVELDCVGDTRVNNWFTRKVFEPGKSLVFMNNKLWIKTNHGINGISYTELESVEVLDAKLSTSTKTDYGKIKLK